MNRQVLYEVTWKLQRAITPSLKYSQEIYEELLNEYCHDGARWLDLGCGHHLLAPWHLEQEKLLASKPELLVGIDFDYLSLTKHKTIKRRVRGDIGRLPFADAAFDLISSNMTFEHLENPEDQLREIRRVLAPGGILIFHTPSKYGYGTLMARMIPNFMKEGLISLLEGRKEEDVFRTFYRINSRTKITRLAEQAGLAIQDLKLICSSCYFNVFPPLALLELLWIKFLMSKAGRPLRTNIVVILEKA